MAFGVSDMEIELCLLLPLSLSYVSCVLLLLVSPVSQAIDTTLT